MVEQLTVIDPQTRLSEFAGGLESTETHAVTGDSITGDSITGDSAASPRSSLRQLTGPHTRPEPLNPTSQQKWGQSHPRGTHHQDGRLATCRDPHTLIDCTTTDPCPLKDGATPR